MNQVSKMADSLIGSEIIKLAGEVNQKIAAGIPISNFTIGDFDPAVFPIPEELTALIIKAYHDGHTNYPPGNGVAQLRVAIAAFVKRYLGLDYAPEQYLIAGGARPLIFSLFQTIIDPGDKVVFPVPSWNNNHYCHITGAQAITIETDAAHNYMPTAEQIAPYLKDAVMLSICSPLNPTGTTFTKAELFKIGELVLAENKRRTATQKPLYILYDQIYWTLTLGNTQHENPVSLIPALRPYTIFIDGLSKAFAATGVRVGWAFGPDHIMNRMQAILSHLGAWSPKAEQVASAFFLQNTHATDAYLSWIRTAIAERLFGFYNGIQALKQRGYPVDAIAPQAAIYLTVNVNVLGKRTRDGQMLTDPKAITQFLLDNAHLAMVPFYAFGANPNSTWFRLSIGTCKSENINQVLKQLESALNELE